MFVVVAGKTFCTCSGADEVSISFQKYAWPVRRHAKQEEKNKALIQTPKIRLSDLPLLQIRLTTRICVLRFLVTSQSLDEDVPPNFSSWC